MPAPRSLRSQLLVGSLLWTIGVMLFVSVALFVFLATHPRPHAVLLDWMLSLPLAVTATAAVACMVAGIWSIRAGLSGMDRLRTALVSIQRGERTQVDTGLPGEVQPLVDAVNGLLADREARVQRAMARAGDLAHGLKTPLAVLAADAARAATGSDPALAESLQAQIDRMRRQIDYHLAHARASAAANRSDLRTPVEPAVEALFRALSRIHADRPATRRLTTTGLSEVSCQREDLDEMLGNLLDNACIWARSRVEVSVATAGARTTMVIDDDGPGIAPSMRGAVLARGVRADERVPGSGLGLAITRELAEVYGGALELTDGPFGGLRVRLHLPAAPPRTHPT